MPAQVSIIIATMAAAERASSLQRAIASVRAASSQPVQLIVVVNGNRRDPALLQWLSEQPDVQVAVSPPPSLPQALLRGRELVTTPYFGTLDDDDEFLPGTLDERLARLCAADQPDLVVSNGIRRSAEGDRQTYASLDNVQQQPLAALFQRTWLQSCNGLYRSTSVGPAFFADYHAYAEWTWLAFCLAQAGKRIAALDVLTYICHDTPGSLSKSPAYAAAYQDLYRRMMARRPPPDILNLVQRRLGASWHDVSVNALAEGRLLLAWKAHWQSLLAPGGSRYLAYSRRLLLGWSRS